MASSREYLDYVLEQLRDIDGISSRYMMSEFIIYCGRKVVGGIYDDRFLLKGTPSALKILEQQGIQPQWEIPYDGAKPMLAADIDDRELCCRMVEAIEEDLPEPRRRSRT